MMADAWTSVEELLRRGGIVMWPLLLLSVVALALVLERCWFFMWTNHPRRRGRVARMSRLLRSGQRDEAAALATADRSVYGLLVQQLLHEPEGGDAAAVEALETQRRRLERFLPTLSTIITAAPMLGILGTVLGIIASFEILAERTATTDPRSVGQGIAEALLTTALGLVIAVVTLFPYNAFRAQVDRTLSRLESLAQAVRQAAGESALSPVKATPTPPGPPPAQAGPPVHPPEDGAPTPLGP